MTLYQVCEGFCYLVSLRRATFKPIFFGCGGTSIPHLAVVLALKSPSGLDTLWFVPLPEVTHIYLIRRQHCPTKSEHYTNCRRHLVNGVTSDERTSIYEARLLISKLKLWDRIMFYLAGVHCGHYNTDPH